MWSLTLLRRLLHSVPQKPSLGALTPSGGSSSSLQLKARRPSGLPTPLRSRLLGLRQPTPPSQVRPTKPLPKLNCALNRWETVTAAELAQLFYINDKLTEIFLVWLPLKTQRQKSPLKSLWSSRLIWSRRSPNMPHPQPHRLTNQKTLHLKHFVWANQETQQKRSKQWKLAPRLRRWDTAHYTFITM